MKIRLDLWVEEDEKKLLNDYCLAVGRSKTEIVRELLRTLKVPKKPS